MDIASALYIWFAHHEVLVLLLWVSTYDRN